MVWIPEDVEETLVAPACAVVVVVTGFILEPFEYFFAIVFANFAISLDVPVVVQ